MQDDRLLESLVKRFNPFTMPEKPKDAKPAQLPPGDPNSLGNKLEHYLGVATGLSDQAPGDLGDFIAAMAGTIIPGKAIGKLDDGTEIFNLGDRLRRRTVGGSPQTKEAVEVLAERARRDRPFTPAPDEQMVDDAIDAGMKQFNMRPSRRRVEGPKLDQQVDEAFNQYAMARPQMLEEVLANPIRIERSSPHVVNVRVGDRVVPKHSPMSQTSIPTEFNPNYIKTTPAYGKPAGPGVAETDGRLWADKLRETFKSFGYDVSEDEFNEMLRIIPNTSARQRAKAVAPGDFARAYKISLPTRHPALRVMTKEGFFRKFNELAGDKGPNNVHWRNKR